MRNSTWEELFSTFEEQSSTLKETALGPGIPVPESGKGKNSSGKFWKFSKAGK
jgi:hypothetical protein